MENEAPPGPFSRERVAARSRRSGQDSRHHRGQQLLRVDHASQAAGRPGSRTDHRYRRIPVEGRLRQGHASTRRTSEARRSPICSTGVDVLYHLAFIVGEIQDKDETRDINVNGSRNVFSACARNAVKQGHLHQQHDRLRLSPGQSDRLHGRIPDMPRNEDNYYNTSKVEVEDFVIEFFEDHPEITLTIMQGGTPGRPEDRQHVLAIVVPEGHRSAGRQRRSQPVHSRARSGRGPVPGLREGPARGLQRHRRRCGRDEVVLRDRGSDRPLAAAIPVEAAREPRHSSCGCFRPAAAGSASASTPSSVSATSSRRRPAGSRSTRRRGLPDLHRGAPARSGSSR